MIQGIPPSNAYPQNAAQPKIMDTRFMRYQWTLKLDGIMLIKLLKNDHCIVFI